MREHEFRTIPNARLKATTDTRRGNDRDELALGGPDGQDRTRVQDIEAGEEPIPLTKLPRRPLRPRQDGEPMQVAFAFRIKGRERVEVPRIGGRFHATKPAALRLLTRRNERKAAEGVRTAARDRRDLRRAERELDDVGI